jgi:hypothetical protein
MKEICLQDFFKEMHIDLDTDLRQEYNLMFEIDGDKVTISFIETDDWDDGGIL